MNNELYNVRQECLKFQHAAMSSQDLTKLLGVEAQSRLLDQERTSARLQQMLLASKAEVEAASVAISSRDACAQGLQQSLLQCESSQSETVTEAEKYVERLQGERFQVAKQLQDEYMQMKVHAENVFQSGVAVHRCEGALQKETEALRDEHAELRAQQSSQQTSFIEHRKQMNVIQQ